MSYTPTTFKTLKWSAIAAVILALLTIEACYPIGDGGVVFYQCYNCTYPGNIYISVDGNSIGEIDLQYSVSCSPGCSGSIFPSFNGSAGEHTFTVKNAAGAILQQGSFTLNKQKCTEVQVNPSGCTSQNGGGGGGGGGGSSCGSYSLTGTWTRQNDGGCTGAAGMVVYFNGTSGVIQSTPSNSCGFYNGQVKWTGYDNSACTINDLNMPGNVYDNYSITFNSANSVTIGSVTYTH